MSERLERWVSESWIEVAGADGNHFSNEITLPSGNQSHEDYSPFQSGLYTLRLSTACQVDSWRDIDTADVHLKLDLQRLCWIWPFSGGSFLKFVEYETSTKTIHQGNFGEVKRVLQEREGWMESSSSMAISWTAKKVYCRAPLCSAVSVMEAAQNDDHFWAMAECLYLTEADSGKWFLHLYKISDHLINRWKNLQGVAGDLTKAQIVAASSALGISADDWEFFREKPNRDYNQRHPREDARTDVVMPADEAERMKRIGKSWFYGYARHMGYILVESA